MPEKKPFLDRFIANRVEHKQLMAQAGELYFVQQLRRKICYNPGITKIMFDINAEGGVRSSKLANMEVYGYALQNNTSIVLNIDVEFYNEVGFDTYVTRRCEYKITPAELEINNAKDFDFWWGMYHVTTIEAKLHALDEECAQLVAMKKAIT